MSSKHTPLITHISWGHIEVAIGGDTYRFKDCKVWPGGAEEWDWSITGTHHHPGVQPTDIEDLLAHSVQVVVISRGMALQLHVSPETEHLLRSRKVEYHIEETRKAVELFNRLAQQGTRVAGVFHSTC